jgi:hypothetical protein
MEYGDILREGVGCTLAISSGAFGAMKNGKPAAKTQEQVEEPNLGNPSGGLQVRAKTKTSCSMQAQARNKLRPRKFVTVPAISTSFPWRLGNQTAPSNRPKNRPIILPQNLDGQASWGTGSAPHI